MAASEVGQPATGAANTLLARLSTDEGECSLAARGAKKGAGGPCSTKPVIRLLSDFIVTVDSGSADSGAADSGAALAKKDGGSKTVQAAAAALSCSTEACVLNHPKFREFASKRGAAGAVARDAERNFKTRGPRDSTQLLSNFNIDGVLQEWAAADPSFYNYGFNMMDFEETGGSLARVDPVDILRGRAPQDLGRMGGVVRRPCTTFACVLNTDVSTGRGKHWVAVFGDCRPRGGAAPAVWTVEYFNSAGNPPPPPVTRWMEETAARLETAKEGPGRVDVVCLSDLRHQDSHTECGLYCLYYIRRRLEAAPLSEFRGERIPDEAMTEFRRHVFRAGG